MSPAAALILVRDRHQGPKPAAALLPQIKYLLSRWMFPDYADWWHPVRRNQMVLRIPVNPRMPHRLMPGNWYEIL